MSLYIIIDGGTTNTRINLVENKKIIDDINLNVGARMGIDNKNLLKAEIKKAIHKLLKQNNRNEKDVVRILSSGMITSEFGLCNLEHIKTPAGVDELHNGMKEIVLKEIADIPFVFIRGVKMDAQSFENTDIMRGEETEIMGLISADYGKCVYVLPGSHSKIISTDDTGKICSFFTMLTGEMIASLSQHTILKDSVDLNTYDINNEFLLKGYDYCKSEGINKSLFKTRILKNVFQCNAEELYSFFMGTVLCGEIQQIINLDAETVVIGGKSQIKVAMSVVLNARDNKKIVTLDDKIVNKSTSLGAIRIFENDTI